MKKEVKTINHKLHISICFLILHYMDEELTSKTIKSVLDLNNFGNSQIVVVDNASPNGSGKLLEKKYKNKREIHVVLSAANVGFSAGNNIGFQYIKSNFISDFIIAINNDILFHQKDFIDKLKILYLESPFWVAGPDIYLSHRGYHSSPMREYPFSKQEARTLIDRFEWEKHQLAKKYSLYGIKLYLRDCLSSNIIISIAIKLNRFIQSQQNNYKDRQEGIVLQGSCLIFDKRFCEKNDKLFLPLTFMYAEEDILTWQCVSNNWEIRYFPEIQVKHIGEGSLQFFELGYRQYCDKKIIKLDKLQEAYKIYLQVFDCLINKHVDIK